MVPTNYVEPSSSRKGLSICVSENDFEQKIHRQMICPPASLVVQRHYDMCRRRPRFLTQLKHGKMWKHVEALERTATRFLTCVMQNKSVIKENYPSPHTSTDSIVCERSLAKGMQGDKGKIGG